MLKSDILILSPGVGVWFGKSDPHLLFWYYSTIDRRTPLVNIKHRTRTRAIVDHWGLIPTRTLVCDWQEYNG